ncbi:MAG: GDP-mannose 4,6-dehydratase [Candidatus Cohnella colombiensis]|uniref:GDP-mannose 4,6-dehydratase n=1 Tax=Candidatus Cohnella colombiensis TaxID=3121368 RepID=A0AA95EYE7_9BACL|nr:MAG: GDP-mannose 4,6-dehydratase [Cohnella sp.]
MPVKAIVTGGAGFIGSHLVELLLEEGVQTHVIDNLSTGSLSNVHPLAVVHVADVRSDRTIELIVREQPDIVYHLAAQADVSRSIEDAEFDADVNIIGTVKLLEACKLTGRSKLVLASTSSVYGHLHKSLICENDSVAPASFFGLSKLTAESYIRLFHKLYHVPYTILRIANVYGPRQTPKGEGGVIAVFIDKIRKGLPLTIHGDGEQTRDFVYVKDVARAALSTLYRGHQNTFHVSTATPTSINQLIAILSDFEQVALPVRHGPSRIGDIKHSCLDNYNARIYLGWRPTTVLAHGLIETFR